MHAIAGGLLGGVNGVDGAIKAAIGAGVSTIIAPYIKDIVDQAVAQSGLKGANAKRVSDSLTSSIVLGLLSGAGSSDATAYAGNELKYNYLWTDKSDKLAKELEELDKQIFEKCGSGGFEKCDPKLKEEILEKFNNDVKEANEDHEFTLRNLFGSCKQDPQGEECKDTLVVANYSTMSKHSSLFVGRYLIDNYEAHDIALTETNRAVWEGTIKPDQMEQYYYSIFNEIVKIVPNARPVLQNFLFSSFENRQALLDSYNKKAGQHESNRQQIVDNAINAAEKVIDIATSLPSLGINGTNIKNVYKSIKDAPTYPKGFEAARGQTFKYNINNKTLEADLRQIELGKWQKIYKNGYDVNGKQISIHYFESPSGKAFNVKVKSSWSESP